MSIINKVRIAKPTGHRSHVDTRSSTFQWSHIAKSPSFTILHTRQSANFRLLLKRALYPSYHPKSDISPNAVIVCTLFQNPLHRLLKYAVISWIDGSTLQRCKHNVIRSLWRLLGTGMLYLERIYLTTPRRERTDRLKRRLTTFAMSNIVSTLQRCKHNAIHSM